MPSLNIYTVNCNRANSVLTGGMGSSKRGPLYHVLACQEIGANGALEDYDSIATGSDADHDLNVMVFLHAGQVDPNAAKALRGNREWQHVDGKGLHMPASRTGRAIAVAAISHNSNRKFEVWVASMHCKSGETFKRYAQKELNETLNSLLDDARSGGPIAVVLTGDLNWASVGQWQSDYADKFSKYYTAECYFGRDQKSGRSLMQTIVLSAKTVRMNTVMKDLALTAEGHVILHTELDFDSTDGSKRQRTG